MDRQVAVEEVGEPDPERLGGRAGTGPGSPSNENGRLVVCISSRLLYLTDRGADRGNPPGAVAVDESERLGAMPVDMHDCHGLVGQDAGDLGAQGQFLEPSHHHRSSGAVVGWRTDHEEKGTPRLKNVHDVASEPRSGDASRHGRPPVGDPVARLRRAWGIRTNIAQRVEDGHVYKLICTVCGEVGVYPDFD